MPESERRWGKRENVRLFENRKYRRFENGEILPRAFVFGFRSEDRSFRIAVEAFANGIEISKRGVHFVLIGQEEVRDQLPFSGFARFHHFRLPGIRTNERIRIRPLSRSVDVLLEKRGEILRSELLRNPSDAFRKGIGIDSHLQRGLRYPIRRNAVFAFRNGFSNPVGVGFLFRPVTPHEFENGEIVIVLPFLRVVRGIVVRMRFQALSKVDDVDEPVFSEHEIANVQVAVVDAVFMEFRQERTEFRRNVGDEFRGENLGLRDIRFQERLKVRISNLSGNRIPNGLSEIVFRTDFLAVRPIAFDHVFFRLGVVIEFHRKTLAVFVVLANGVGFVADV